MPWSMPSFVRLHALRRQGGFDQVRQILPTIVTIGFMGAGKTSVGRLVARALGREFADTDEMIERATRVTVDELFKREGELGFRRREAAAIDRAIAIPGRVVAVGGGAVLSAENRTALKQAGLLVYLRATPETLAGRLAGTTGRPLLNTGDRVGRIRDLLVARGPIYETAGDVAIDTDRLTLEQTAAEVLEWYRRRVGALAGR
jgi:shikimate kinase